MTYVKLLPFQCFIFLKISSHKTFRTACNKPFCAANGLGIKMACWNPNLKMESRGWEVYLLLWSSQYNCAEIVHQKGCKENKKKFPVTYNYKENTVVCPSALFIHAIQHIKFNSKNLMTNFWYDNAQPTYPFLRHDFVLSNNHKNDDQVHRTRASVCVRSTIWNWLDDKSVV